MNEMISYIFTSLKCSEIALNNLRKVVRRQNNINASFAFFVITTTLSIGAMNGELRSQSKQIAKLTEEIEELKKTKGE